MQTLVPISVPWMISPSVSDIRVTCIENDGAVVSVEVAVLPEGDIFEGLPNRRVKIWFEAGQWMRTAPAVGRFLDLSTQGFDFSHLETWGDPMKFRSNWAGTGNCPDPSVYRVENSLWMAQTNASRWGCQHFVVKGHDMWLEILARSLSWTWDEDTKAEAIETAGLE